MTPEERRQRIKDSHAKKLGERRLDGGRVWTREEAAAIIARVEAAEIARSEAIAARRIAEIEAFKASLTRPIPRP